MTMMLNALQRIRQSQQLHNQQRRHLAALTAAAATIAATTASFATATNEQQQQEYQQDESSSAVRNDATTTSSSSSSSLNPPSFRSSPQQQEQAFDSRFRYELLSLLSNNVHTHNITRCDSGGFASGWGFFGGNGGGSRLQRTPTVDLLDQTSTKEATLESTYDVDYSKPLGQGAFGAVYSAIHKVTGERVAVKKISKELVDHPTFQKEMDALLILRQAGGHPNVCSLRENFEVDDHFFLVLDYIGGREMFEQLCHAGPYSEAEAARHIREVASALSFIHGIGIIHSDIKPENLMLSSKDAKSAVVKIVDMGNAHILDDDDHDDNDASSSSQYGHRHKKLSARSPSYCPPEVLKELQDKANKDGYVKMEPSFDMWSLGVVIYIMLVGMHPFDPTADATYDQIEARVLSGRKPPLRGSRYTRHLTKSAIDLIEGLMEWDPEKRMTAQQVLENKWVRGETATLKKMANSDRRLAAYRKYKEHVGSAFFKAFLAHKDSVQPKRLASSTVRRTSGDRNNKNNNGNNNNNNGATHVERESVLKTAFRRLDSKEEGYLAPTDIHDEVNAKHKLSYSEAHQLVAESMKNRYFAKGHTLYKEGDVGNVLYLVDSGTIEVTTEDGFQKVRESGDLVGVNAMMSGKDGVYHQTAKCLTPVHVLEIPRDVFDEYMSRDKETALSMEETTRHIRRERANAILRSNPECKEKQYKEGDVVFKAGSRGATLYMIESGEVDLSLQGGIKVRSVQPGELIGEHASYHPGKPYSATAKCITSAEEGGCKLVSLSSSAMHKVFAKNEPLRHDFRELMLRRDFKKAVCAETKRPFPTTAEEIRETFDQLDTDGTLELALKKLRHIVHRFDPSYKEEDIRDMLESLDLTKTGSITWEEFNRIFVMDKES